MRNPVQQKILNALLMTLRPLARALLRSGIGYTEFADMAKLAFVNVAATEFGVRNRATNNSRIAVMTGLSRKEVKRYKSLGESALAEDFVKETPASVILQHWYSDPDFTNANGQPRVLRFEGGINSFSELVARHAGDIPPGAMRAELKRVGAVEELQDKTLKVCKRAYFPDGANDRIVIFLEEVLAAAFHTAAYNCKPDLEEGVTTRFLAIASEDGVSKKLFPEVKRHARQELLGLGTQFSSYLEEMKQREDAPSGEDAQVGMGLFYYELGTED